MKWLLVMTLLLSACAHYSIPDRPGALAVSTIKTPPQWQIPEGELTQSLVKNLERRGFEASWGGAIEGQTAMDCVCNLDVSMNQMTDARAEMICDYAGARLTTSGSGSGHSIPARAAYIACEMAGKEMADEMAKLDTKTSAEAK